MLVFKLVQGGLDGGVVGHGRVGVPGAAGPQGDGAAGLEELGGAPPEARHVEPVGGRGGSDEVDAGVRDGRRELGAEIFGRGDLEADGFGGGRDTAKGPGGADHPFRGVKTDGMSEVRCELADGGAWTAADIEDGGELAAGGRVVVEDGLVQVRMVAAAVLGVCCALFVGVGAEGLFF